MPDMLKPQGRAWGMGSGAQRCRAAGCADAVPRRAPMDSAGLDPTPARLVGKTAS